VSRRVSLGEFGDDLLELARVGVRALGTSPWRGLCSFEPLFHCYNNKLQGDTAVPHIKYPIDHIPITTPCWPSAWRSCSTPEPAYSYYRGIADWIWPLLPHSVRPNPFVVHSHYCSVANRSSWLWAAVRRAGVVCRRMVFPVNRSRPCRTCPRCRRWPSICRWHWRG
jgi:hypothetical protein